MKRIRIIVILALCCLLTGCASLLEREYVVVEPHSGRFWESEAADILRAEGYQDVVNDLLLLVTQHTETATLRLYNYNDEARVTEALERAAQEVQQQTPMGAYAVDYITSFSQQQRGYYEVSIQIGYRRTEEQIQSVMNATSGEAIYSLLDSVLDRGTQELAVRIGYWNEQSQRSVEEAVERLRTDRGLTEAHPWIIHYYPATEDVGLVEILMAEGAVAEEAFLRPSALVEEAEPDEETGEAVESAESTENGEPAETPGALEDMEPEAE